MKDNYCTPWIESFLVITLLLLGKPVQQDTKTTVGNPATPPDKASFQTPVKNEEKDFSKIVNIVAGKNMNDDKPYLKINNVFKNEIPKQIFHLSYNFIFYFPNLNKQIYKDTHRQNIC